MLLLDEPAAGLTQDERVEMADADRPHPCARDEHRLVEHDMRVMMGLCSRIVVLDHGEVIADVDRPRLRRTPPWWRPISGAPPMGEPARGERPDDRLRPRACR